MRRYTESDCLMLISAVLNEPQLDSFVASMNLLWDIMRILYETDQITHEQYQHIKSHWFMCMRYKKDN